ncbi:hypothetical protein HK097_009685 [Rhizophlyctis rosea]|uniref:Uncharacterized protein n=1 Tax=Rhizophlyctis rosea TaxID=64517 RepID=A0AAD5SGL5_9FUNG|nr:hypothetical protein HK097_009685 [Rhizophlyctis rosea]
MYIHSYKPPAAAAQAPQPQPTTPPQPAPPSTPPRPSSSRPRTATTPQSIRPTPQTPLPLSSQPTSTINLQNPSPPYTEATSTYTTSSAILPQTRSNIPSNPSSRPTSSSTPYHPTQNNQEVPYNPYTSLEDTFDYSLLESESQTEAPTNHPQGNVIFETQQIAPAPGQTWFQLAVLEGRGRSAGDGGGEGELEGEEGHEIRPRSGKPDPTDGIVVLRDWPKKRFSQKWTRNGPNPGERRMKYEDFLQGELEERLVYIFGRDVYDTAIRAVQHVIAERRKSFDESEV